MKIIDVEMNRKEFEELLKYYGIDRNIDESTILQEDDWSIQLKATDDVKQLLIKDNIAFWKSGEIWPI